MTYTNNNPYELWDLRKSLGVRRNIIPAYTYWLDMFTGQVNSTDEYIDFEKLPALNRRLAPFVRPLARGKPIYTDSSTGYRFKPTYIKLNDVIDPMRVMRKIPGVDPMLSSNMDPNDPMVRREALRAAMAQQHITTIQRRWEWLAARAIIDSKVTLTGEDYPTTQVDFRRDAGQTITLGSGSRWGDSGVSIMDFIQEVNDLMIRPVGGFGGAVTRITLGSNAWSVMRKDPEIKDLMSKIIMNPGADIQRGLTSSDKVAKVGEIPIGGANGSTVELIRYADTYQADDGTETPFMSPNDVVFTSSPQAIDGQRCFGAIIDPYAQYQSLDIFSRNYMDQGDPAAEWMLDQSAPLMVPINPNATLKATVVNL